MRLPKRCGIVAGNVTENTKSIREMFYGNELLWLLFQLCTLSKVGFVYQFDYFFFVNFLWELLAIVVIPFKIQMSMNFLLFGLIERNVNRLFRFQTTT